VEHCKDASGGDHITRAGRYRTDSGERKKYLVTGGCGFIGSHLVDALHGNGHYVRILDDLSTGTLDHKPSCVEFMRGDVSDAATVSAAMQDMDGCFHLAAIASVERSNSDWLSTHRINVTGAVAVFEAARSAWPKPVPVIYASSAAVYGDSANIPLSEDVAPRPLSPYAADKLGCELHGFIAANIHGVPNCGLRFFNVYGPRQDPSSPYSGVISIFCDRMGSDREITIHGDGQQTRDFIFVRDVVRALLAAMDKCPRDGGVFNICTGRATSVLDLVRILATILRVKPQLRFAPPRTGDIRHSVGDPGKARRMFGFLATSDLASGLRAILSRPHLIKSVRQSPLGPGMTKARQSVSP